MNYIIIGIIISAVMITSGLFYVADAIKLFAAIYAKTKIEEMEDKK